MGLIDDLVSAAGAVGDAIGDAIDGLVSDGDRREGGVDPRRLLPGATALMPYVAAQLLADLGESPTELTDRAVRRMRKALPVPREQRVLWADVAFGTRSHGLVLTDAGVVIKDGPGDDEGDDEDDAPEGQSPDDADASGLECVGLGYRYVRWCNFDPARVSHDHGAPTLDGVPFRDAERFRGLAMACVRICNRRVRARRAGRSVAGVTGILGPGAPMRSVCRRSVEATFEFCFDAEGEYKFYADAPGTFSATDPARAAAVRETFDDPLVPKAVEVPLDQYDAMLARMRRAIGQGRVPMVEDPDAAGALVRCGGYTYLQASNLARCGRIPGVEYREATGSVVCRDPAGLGELLERWLELRARLGGGRLPSGRQEARRAGEVAQGVGRALASGSRARADAGRDPRAVVGRDAARMVASSAASSAGYAVGATGARVLLSAFGVAGGPLTLVAGFALGDACGKAGTEAFRMAKDLLVEPSAQIMARLFDGVLSNIVFEYALTPSEQSLLAELMARADPRLYQALGASLGDAPDQEGEIRRLVVPMVEAVRGAGA